jgi:hypothetical protein
MGYYYPSGPLGPVCDVVLTDEQKKGLRPTPVTDPDPYITVIDYGHPDWTIWEDIYGRRKPWKTKRRCKERTLKDGTTEYYDCVNDWDGYDDDDLSWKTCIDPEGICYAWSPYNKDTFGLDDNFQVPILTPDTCVDYDPDINILPIKFFLPNGTAVTRYKKQKSTPVTFAVTSEAESIISDDLLSASFDPSGNLIATSDTASTSGTVILDFEWSDNPNAYDTALGTYSVGGITFTQTPGVRHGTAQASVSVTSGSSGSGPTYNNTYTATITDNSGGFEVRDEGKTLCFKDLHGNDCNATVRIGQVNTEDVQTNIGGHWSEEGNTYAVWVNPEVCTLPGLVQEISYKINLPETTTYGFTFGCDDNAEIFLNGSNSAFMTAEGGIFRSGPLSTPYTATTSLNAGENDMTVRITNSYGSDNTWNVNPAGIAWVVRDSGNSIVASSLQCTAAGNTGQLGTSDWVRTGPPSNADVPWTQFLDDYAIYSIKPADTEIDPYINSWQKAETFINIPTEGSYTIEFQSDNKSKFILYGPTEGILFNQDIDYTAGLGTQTINLGNLSAGNHRMQFSVVNLYRGDPFNWDVNPGGYYIKICKGGLCASSTSVAWVRSSPHMDWSDFMNTYAVFSSNQNTHAGVTQNATWNVNIPAPGNYELEVQGDNTVDIGFDGVNQGTVSSFQTSTTYTLTGLTEGNHIITAAVNNATGPNDDRWGNNPAGVAWVLRQQSSQNTLSVSFDSNGNLVTTGAGEGTLDLDLSWDEDIQTYSYSSNVSVYFDGAGNLVASGSGTADVQLNFSWADNPSTAGTALGTYSVAGASFTQGGSYSGSDSATVNVTAGQTYTATIIDNSGGFTIRDGGSKICFKDRHGEDCNASVVVGTITNQSGTTTLNPTKALGTYAIAGKTLTQGAAETGSASVTINVKGNKTYPAVILNNPYGFVVQNSGQKLCFKDSDGWVKAIDGNSTSATNLWGPILKNYGIYPSNTQPLVGNTFTANWTITVSVAGTYVFEVQADNQATISWQGSLIGTTTVTSSHNTSSFFSVNNVTAGTYAISATINNISNQWDTWDLNPAGVGWILRDPQNTIVASSLSTQDTPCKADITVGTFTATNAIIASSLDLNHTGDGNLTWHTRMAIGWEYSTTQ